MADEAPAIRLLEDMTTTERIGLAMWLLQQQPMTTADMAKQLGVTWDGASKMLSRLARAVPLRRVGECGVWELKKPRN